MSVFRKELYRRYITTFKIVQSQIDDSTLRSYWAWCEHKYLPLLDGLDPNDPVLELGCGPGYMMQFLKRHGFSTVVVSFYGSAADWRSKYEKVQLAGDEEILGHSQFPVGTN